MRNKLLRRLALVCAAAVLTCGLAGCGGTTPEAASSSAASAAAESTAFEPKLDTEKEVALEASGFFGNFEALDQVLNNFNEYYPNVTISYEQNNGDKLVEYLKNNPYVDIIMTDDTNLRYPDWVDSYIADQCADLTAEGIDVSAVQPELLEECTFDGKVLRIPFAENHVGMVVNKTLLEKEGLSVPTNYADFLTTLEALKQAGYTPIQGSENSIYTELVYNMAMCMIGSDPKLLDALNNGDESAVETLTPVFEKIEELKKKGYVDSRVNAEYPADNYDGAILKFFEGDVPFWVCNTEKYSGMKKRESKSEAFSASPFEYAFIDVPMGDNGVYEYVEPWFGFSVNKNSDDYDYAVEFIRFLAQEEQLNTLASVKGVPTATNNNTDARFDDINSQPQVAVRYVNDGTVMNHVKDYFGHDAENCGKGEMTAEEAARDYVARCAETAREMAEAAQ